MADIARGRTVIIIAHRLSTVRSAHRILTLDKGRLVEDGTHDQLVNTGGRYASLHHIQAGPAKRNRAELAFLPAALEITDTPPSPVGRAIVWR